MKHVHYVHSKMVFVYKKSKKEYEVDAQKWILKKAYQLAIDLKNFIESISLHLNKKAD